VTSDPGDDVDKTLRAHRGDLQRSWDSGVAGGTPPAAVRDDVRSSWARSATTVSLDLDAAPVREPEDVVARWADSPLGRASRIILDDLEDLANSGDMMAAITDDTVTIAWLAGGRTMSRRADRVHFAVGGCWDEGAVGTNALALARTTAKPSAVFSAEHYAPMVHEWVCYSAPILDPHTGRFLGVLDLSAPWHRAQPTLLTTVGALARCVEYELAAQAARSPAGQTSGRQTSGRQTSGRQTSGRRTSGRQMSGGPAASVSVGGPGADDEAAVLELRTLGTPEVRVGGQVCSLSPRQLELLTVLSLHPDGLTLDELTGRVYGDRPVSRSTVKAELSHLRHLLGGRIGSRPYRLAAPFTSDHHRLAAALGSGDLDAAVALYRGSLLATSDSPEIQSWRHHLDVAVRDAMLSSARPDVLYRFGQACPDDLEVHEATLAALADGDPRHSVVAGRLAAAST
jgi:hypothetical protein